MKPLYFFLFLLLLLLVLIFTLRFEYAYVPHESGVIAYEPRGEAPAYDLWGASISGEEAGKLLETAEGRQRLSASNGAVRITPELLSLGRGSFYTETFGNEVFFTDILGAMNGPITWRGMSKAILALKGKGTDNLEVELSEDANIGGYILEKGHKVKTGLDVPRGAMVPLGIKVQYDRGKLRMGISCAACHSTVDPVEHRVIEGAANRDIRPGLLIAMGTNSASFFLHTDVGNLDKFGGDFSRSVITAAGEPKPLPDSSELEKAVDAALMNWPPGHFDSTIDAKNNPSQIPDSYTFGEHPYGWTGFAGIGPFKGLAALNNNVHAVNSDSLAQAGAVPALFGIDKEVYLGTVLQNAASKKYRFDPDKKVLPSEFFARVDPTPAAAGVNEIVELPSFPKASYIALQGTLTSSPGNNVWEQNYAMSAWQNTLRPPPPPEKAKEAVLKQGRAVFEKANCVSCHSGPLLTNNQIIPVQEIRTEPSRAKANKDLEKILVESVLYSPDTPVPLPEKPRVLQVPIMPYQREQAQLAWAHAGTDGGYKVPGLTGLYYSAPYLHDGGAAAGKNLDTELGMAGTFYRGIPADPVNSLRVLLDRKLRQKAVEANKRNPHLTSVHVSGEGHEFWADEESGFSAEETAALIQYLLSLDGGQKPPGAAAG